MSPWHAGFAPAKAPKTPQQPQRSELQRWLGYMTGISLAPHDFTLSAQKVLGKEFATSGSIFGVKIPTTKKQGGTVLDTNAHWNAFKAKHPELLMLTRGDVHQLMLAIHAAAVQADPSKKGLRPYRPGGFRGGAFGSSLVQNRGPRFCTRTEGWPGLREEARHHPPAGAGDQLVRPLAQTHDGAIRDTRLAEAQRRKGVTLSHSFTVRASSSSFATASDACPPLSRPLCFSDEGASGFFAYVHAHPPLEAKLLSAFRPPPCQSAGQG